ncbi:hypothetical protein [Psychrobacter aquimaris]|uniref:hypothetical protein n=1 Tax=Psychrobacter aquimaris TaxID=292733 RepID=UPI0039C664E4
MKSNTFNYSLLAVGVAAVMGISSGANAAETKLGVQAGTAIRNVATAQYKVGTDSNFQPIVTSNEVIVNVNETPNFSLVSTIADNDNNVDTAINQEAIPGGTTLFTHNLKNEGNVKDTYTVVTAASDSSIVTASPNYLFNTTTINYKINVSGLTTAQLTELQTSNPNTGYTVNNGVATGTLNSTNKTITLLPTLTAELSYNAPTPVAQDGGDFGVGIITAQSSIITGKPTLTNENQTIVKRPVFKIEKSATCNGVTGSTCTNLNLNATDKKVNYSIKVTNVSNSYSKDADNFVIRDVLPTGMTIDPDTPITVTIGGQKVGSVDSTGLSGTRQVLDITVPSLVKGAVLTVNFTVLVNKPAILAANNSNTVINNATVYDNIGDITPSITDKNSITSDTSDSTDDATNNITKVPRSEANGADKDGQDTKSTLTLTDRSVIISPGTAKEVAVTGSVTYSHTITNTGNASEGGTNRPINITITDPNGVNPLNVINGSTDVNRPSYVLPNNGGTGFLEIVDAATGQYKLPNTVILPKDATVNITYTVNSVGNNTNLNNSDTNTLTVTSTGADASSNNAQNTTTIRGLTLLKQVALQAKCTGTLTPYQGTADTGKITTATFTSEPGDCIHYQITATNTFTTVSNLAINNIEVSDKTSLWSAQATYEGDTKAVSSTGSTAGLVNNNTADEAVRTTFATLAPSASANLKFVVKVKP